MQEIFTRHIADIFFFYGLSFFAMGFAILLELGHAPKTEFAQALRPLGWFGIVHGGHEWVEMFLIQHMGTFKQYEGALFLPRLFLLASSFILLLVFGFKLISGGSRQKLLWGVVGAAAGIWIIGLIGISLSSYPRAEYQIAFDVYTRYSLAIPGALLASTGLLVQQRRFSQSGMKSFAVDVTMAAIAFWVYGMIGQLFTTSSVLFPSTIINTGSFLEWFGFPIQLLRAAMACLAAIAIVRSLRTFEVETTRQMEALREAQLQERSRLEQLRNELLHRTVTAQEAERSRIARELHDETGQSLTAISIGLRSLKEKIPQDTARAIQQTSRLEEITSNSILELQRMVAGLHPAQLDDLGLLAGLRWFASDVTQNADVNVEVQSQGIPGDLSAEMRVTLFRIAQEAITNVVRHAAANQVLVSVEVQNGILLMNIQDDGCGFDVSEVMNRKNGSASLGLMGMQERAFLIGGKCQIESNPGEGTKISVTIPLSIQGQSK